MTITFQSHATRNTVNWTINCGETFVAGESDPQMPLGYLRAEFPSEFTNVANSLAKFFLERLPKDNRIEHVYWFSEDDVLKVWIVIPEPDFNLEEPVYAAQMWFIEKFPDLACDFYVIYRFGKSVKDIEPQGAHKIR